MTSEIIALVFLGLLSFFLLLQGWFRGFFHLEDKEWKLPIQIYHVITPFALYISISFITARLALGPFRQKIIVSYLAYASWINALISFCIFMTLWIYWRCLNPTLRWGILLRPNQNFSFKKDLTQAFYAWILSFPLVLWISHLLEQILFKIYNISELPDQIAVQFLKSTFDHPLYFVLAILSIVLFAPLIEETLFRGFLQSYIRQYLGPKQAILITSVCFALFHYASNQGLGNVSIIPSLFILSLFIGLLYEKQGSLVSSMTLHSLFNAISVINLYLFGGKPFSI